MRDHVEDHRIAAQGLPRVKGWLKQFVLGYPSGLRADDAGGRADLLPRTFPHREPDGAAAAPELAAVILALLCGALAEELMFRGYPFQHLEKAIGAVPAVIAFSAIYGVLHVNPHASLWGIANTVLIGVLLSIAYLRTRALWLPWGIHFGWNLTLGLLLGLPVSGFRNYNLLRYTEAYGPEWLTGGKYGVEASMTGQCGYRGGPDRWFRMCLYASCRSPRFTSPPNQLSTTASPASNPSTCSGSPVVGI